MNNYKLYFDSYNKYLENVNEYRHFISNTGKIDLSSIKLSNFEKRTILKHLGTKVNLDSATAEDFENVLDIMFEDKSQLVEYLQELYTDTKQPITKKHFQDLLSIAYSKAVSDAHITLPYTGKRQLCKSWTMPCLQGAFDIVPYILKSYEYRDYMFKKSLDNSYFPTVKADANDPYGFNTLSLSELQAAFSPSNFYNLNTDQVKHLSQAFVNKYLEASNVDSCKVEFVPLRKHGEYFINEGLIQVNQNYAVGFECAKKGLNPVFPLSLMTTLINNATRRIHVASIERDFLSARDEAVKQAIVHPTCTDYYKCASAKNCLSAHYISTPDEIDARNAELEALSYMITENESVKNEEDKNKIAAYYNFLLVKEQDNEKFDYKQEYKDLFQDVYGDTGFEIKNERSTNKEITVSNDQSSDILKYGDFYSVSGTFYTTNLEL